jgi:hypothetical protein
MKRLAFLHGFAALIAVAALSACATGPAFTGPEAPASGQAVVYLYRVSQLPGAGIEHPVLYGPPQKLRYLVNGSYVRIGITAPRQMDQLLQGCSPLRPPLQVETGNTYYVQAALTNKTVHYGGKPYSDFGCVLIVRTEAEALPAITGLPRAD